MALRKRAYGARLITDELDFIFDTARDLGGYHAVLAVHAEGSLEAEKLQMLRSYTANHAPAAIAYARKLDGLD